MSSLTDADDAIEWRGGRGEVVRIEAWGAGAVRVRTASDTINGATPHALLEPAPCRPRLTVTEEFATLSTDSITARITAAGHIAFFDRDDRPLLSELPPAIGEGSAWSIEGRVGTRQRAQATFAAHDDERFYGLGQQQHGRLEQKGIVADLEHRNGHVAIPFLISSRGYGFLWNNPSLGRVELSHDRTRWVAECTPQIDYWVTAADNPLSVVQNYMTATGRAPDMPSWALGFWQSKLRYRTQQELLDVAREYHRRQIPISVIVADFFHWKHHGDWCFDPDEWPDPAAAVAELESYGMKLMVSVWPTIGERSTNHQRFLHDGHLVTTVDGQPAVHRFREKDIPGEVELNIYDATSEPARTALSREISDGYTRHAIDLFWLDACEPEIDGSIAPDIVYAAGPANEVGNLYPRLHAQGFHEHLVSTGTRDIVQLTRSAWAGSQQYGTVLWSGDIESTFAALAAQVPAGLNAALSGLPWWTTDIGGFRFGDPDDPTFRELLTRWFQYGTFCPIFRLHGWRGPSDLETPDASGAPNEIWSFGPEVEQIATRCIELREGLRSYLGEQFRRCHADGTPPMRPTFIDFPDDSACWHQHGEFMLGPDLLVAPIVTEGAPSRRVWLPSGTSWIDSATTELHEGGQELTVDTHVDSIPTFLRSSSAATPAVLSCLSRSASLS